MLAQSTPALFDRISVLPTRTYGLTTGLFYLPLAQALQWAAPFEWVGDLSVALALGSLHFKIQDHLIDEGRAEHSDVLLSDAALLHFMRRLEHLASVSGVSVDRIRAWYDDAYDAYVRSIDIEAAHRGRVDPFTRDAFAALSGKAAPARPVLQLVANATNHAAETAVVIQAADRLCLALQLQDDLQDWRGDLALRNLTLPLTLSLELLGVPYGPFAPEGIDCESVHEALHFGGVVEATLELATQYVGEARALAAAAGAHAIEEFAVQWHRESVALRRRLASQKAMVLGRGSQDGVQAQDMFLC